MKQSDVTKRQNGKSGDERDEEYKARGRFEKDYLRGCGRSIGIVSATPFCNENISYSTTAENVDRKTLLLVKDMMGDIGSHITRPALMAVKRGKAS